MQQQQQQALQPGTRKKIEHYSYALGDRIGKGYSSVVYRGRNDQSSKSRVQAVAYPSLSLDSLEGLFQMK